MAVNTSGMTGAPTAGPVMFQPPSNAPTGSSGNMNFGNSSNTTPPMPTTENPYSTTTSGTSTNTFAPISSPVSMNPSGSPTSGNAFDQTGRQQDRTLAEMQKYYGEGMGSMLYQYLQSGGGFNSGLTTQAINAQDQAMQHQIMEGFNTLGTNLAESGISPNSSVAALEKSNYMTQATANENAIAAQEFYNMWNSGQQREAGILSDTAQVNATGTANQPSGLAQLQSWMGLATSGAQSISAGISALNPAADTGILDLFGALAI